VLTALSEQQKFHYTEELQDGKAGAVVYRSDRELLEGTNLTVTTQPTAHCSYSFRYHTL
jgi:hypothetical protein